MIFVFKSISNLVYSIFIVSCYHISPLLFNFLKSVIPILELVNLRTKYKKDKNFEEADKVRDKLLSLGYKVLDTREGVKIERI